MALKYLADTNAFIYLLNKHPVIKPLLEYEWGYSFITRIELLGKQGISRNEIKIVKEVLDICTAFPHSEAINEIEIQIRQTHKIKTPDAIIAATGIYYYLPLLTADRDFTNIEDLDIILLEL